MGPGKRALIVAAALATYGAIAYVAVMLVALWNWLFRLRACDANCGVSLDWPAQLALHIAYAGFALGLAAGTAWVVAGVLKARQQRARPSANAC
jgi:hypothetical protein